MKKKRRKCDDVVFPIVSLWNFFRRSRTANSVVRGLIWSNLRLIQALMCVIVTDEIKLRKGHDVVFPIISLWIFFRRSRAATSVVHGQIRPNFEFIQALMYVISTCKYEKGPIKKCMRKRDAAVFPIIILWKLSVAMETRVLI